MKKKVISAMSLLIVLTMMCTLLAGCTSGSVSDVAGEYRGNIMYDLKLDSSDNSFSYIKFVSGELEKSGTYTYENGVITFSEGLSIVHSNAFKQTSRWIVDGDVLLLEEQYRKILSEEGRVHTSSNKISGKVVVLLTQYEFSENGVCSEKNPLTGEIEIHSYALSDSGFVYVDDSVICYIYDGVLVPYSDLFVKKDVYDRMHSQEWG